MYQKHLIFFFVKGLLCLYRKHEQANTGLPPQTPGPRCTYLWRARAIETPGATLAAQGFQNPAVLPLLC